MSAKVGLDPERLATAIEIGAASVEELRATATRVAQAGPVHGGLYAPAVQIGAVADRVSIPVERSRASLRAALRHALSQPPRAGGFAFFGDQLFGSWALRFRRKLVAGLRTATDPSLVDFFLFQTRDNFDAFAGLLRAHARGQEYRLARMLRIAGFNTPSYDFEYRPTGNRLMYVSGIGSSSASAREFDAATRALGYDLDRRLHFSYDPDSPDYDADDTFQGLDRATEAFDRQMRAAKAEDPHAAIDIIAHSLGGAVAMHWLKTRYNPNDPAYPRVANVVTLGSPLRGAPASDVDRVADACPAVESAIRGTAAAVDFRIPPDGARSVGDLRTDSAHIERIANRPVPQGVHVDAIAARYDYVVPANRASLPGQDARVVSPEKVAGQHFELLDDPESIAAMRRALNHQPEPPKAPIDEFLDTVAPHAVSTAETGAGVGLRATVCR